MDDDGSKTPIRTTSDSDDDELHSNSGEFDNGDGNDSSQSTVPMNETLVFEEAIETQLVNLVGETQVMDFDCETQIMDFGYETQEVEFGGDTQLLDDFKFVEDMETQLLDSFENEEHEYIDGEVSDSTEVLSDGDELVRKGECLFGETEEVKISSVSKESEKDSMEQPENLGKEQKSSGFPVIATTPVQDLVKPNGSQPKKFTSVRSASLRASGLAAQNAAPKGSKSVSYSSIPTRDFGRINMTESDSRNKSACRESNVAVRKLCYDDDGETDKISDGTTEIGEVSTKFPSGDLAGLSYIGSQEPGDLTQANALDFVDNFVKESMMEFDYEADRGKSTGGKSKRLFIVKGEQKLAKKVSEKSVANGRVGVYDWDDNREDEGGGDILRRINKDLSGGGSLGRKKPSKPRIGNRMGLFNSDSKLLQRNPKVAAKSPVRESKRLFGRNLMNELNLETDIKCDEKVLEGDAPPTEVRFDTQMAAEAMEALFCGEGIGKTDEEESNSIKGKKQKPRGKRPSPDDENPATLQTRKSRRIDAILSSRSPNPADKQGRNAGKKSELNDVTMKSQKARQNLEKMSGENTGKRRGRPPKTSVKSSGPITRRTRSSVEPIARNTRCSGDVTDCGDDKHGLTGNISARGKRSSCRGTCGSEVLTLNDAQVRKNETVKSDLSKEFDKVAGLAIKKAVDTLSFPRRRRSTRISSCQGDKSDEIDDPPEPCINQEVFEPGTRRKRSIREKRSLQRSDMILSDNEEIGRGNSVSVESPRKDKSKPLDSPCATPVNCKIPISDASPVCMGDEYLTKSSLRSGTELAVLREIRKLSNTKPQSVSASKDLRKRRDITNVRVLYSHHLDGDVIKHQKKILARLGVSVASSMEDATHFIADHFVRTKNMLEAIASGKPVVTHLWVDSCGQANCFIDEKHYILRDVKKEREFGFNMSNSLAFTSQHPLLQGFRVLTTPNTKPGLDIISNLVKVVGGQAVERVGRSAMKDGAFPDDLLVLSCDEDYAICVPFLEQGATIYSSELLLNGIVSQKLEYDRYRLFTDHVRKTRSKVWLKKDGTKFLPVVKSNQN